MTTPDKGYPGTGAMNPLFTHRGSLTFVGRAGASVVMASCLVCGCTNATDPAEEIRLEAISPVSLSGLVGQQVTPVPSVRVTSASGRPVPGLHVSFTTTGGNVANDLATSDSNGVATAGTWTLGTAARTYTVSAHSSGLAAVVFTAIAEPGPLASLQPVSGDQQSGNTGETLPVPLRVRAVDAFNNQLPGIPVVFSVASGNGTIDGDTVLTDATGHATSGTWTLGAIGGAQTARAQAGGAQAVFAAVACDPTCQSVQLLFIREGVFYRTNLGGHTTVIAGSGRDHSPALSADGRRLAFMRSEDNGSALYVMSANGSGLVRRATDFHSPAWSPDGRQLAVAQGDCVYNCGIFLISADEDGSSPKRIAGLYAALPAWSPDGAKIAFVSLSGDDGYHALHVMNADGSNVVVISPQDNGVIGRPSWSPDGTQIAFSKCMNSGCDIYVADGLAVHKLTSVGDAHEPAWSPDGTRIAIARWSFTWDDVFTSSVALVDAQNGGDPVEIVAPGWSPLWLPAQPASRVR